MWRQGQEASDNDAWQRATEAFDTVLAQQPLFEHRAEMARAFVGWANLLLEQGKDDQARIALGKALRLAPQSKDVAGVQSRLAMLEGKALIAAGTPDRHILQRAVDLDPGNDKAKELLASLDGKAELRKGRHQRYLAAAGIGLLALVLIILLWRRPRSEVPVAEEAS